MTKEQLQEWVKSARRVDTIRDEYDENGNRDQVLVYKKDGKYYAVARSNGEFVEKWSGRGYIRDEYPEPKEVFHSTREETIWLTKEERDAIVNEESQEQSDLLFLSDLLLVKFAPTSFCLTAEERARIEDIRVKCRPKVGGST